MPKINKLGSDVWAKLKEKTKAKVKEVAFDLIKLYAARKSQVGFAHAPDNYLQTELEASFIYEEVSSSNGFLGLSSSKPFNTSERTGLTALIPCSAEINACARKRLNSRPVLG